MKLLLFILCFMPNICFGGESMKIVINDKTYDVKSEKNDVVEEISANLPLKLSFVKFDGHEFYADLPFKVKSRAEQTSDLKAGHIYYWASGNTFVLNYKDADISPYKSVHLGEFTDKSVSDVLKNSPSGIEIVIDK